eukprot:m51a1_g11073 putative peroxisomal leader peptide-processing protease (659) ;mRNA; f:557908-560018
MVLEGRQIAALVHVEVDDPSGAALRRALAASLVCGRHPGTTRTFARASGFVVCCARGTARVATTGAVVRALAPEPGPAIEASVALAGAGSGDFARASVVEVSSCAALGRVLANIESIAGRALPAGAAELAVLECELPASGPGVAALVPYSPVSVPPAGSTVLVYGTPLGLPSLAHSVVRGVVSSAVRARGEDVLVLVDAKAAPGLEGSIVCSGPTGAPFAVLLCALRMPDQPPTSLSLAAPISLVRALIGVPKPAPPPDQAPQRAASPAEKLQGCLHLLDAGDGRCPVSVPPAGSTVLVYGTPLGLPSLAHSVVRGVVSSAVRARGEDVLVLVDAKAAPGLEGSIVCSGPTGAPFAVLLCALRMPDQPPTSLSLAAPISLVRALIGVPKPAPSPDQAPQRAASPAEKLQGCLHLLDAGDGRWCTAVCVGRSGLAVTCAHLLASLPPGTKVVSKPSGASASVLYVSRTLWDVAIVRLDPAPAEHVPRESMVPVPPAVGTEVLVVGHALLGPKAAGALAAPCLRGTLTQVVNYRRARAPLMLVSTAPSYAGCSGGALADESGRLLGIIVANVETAGPRSPGPVLSLSVPINIVCKALDAAEQGLARGLAAAELQASVDAALETVAANLTANEKKSLAGLWGMTPEYVASVMEAGRPRSKL